MRAQTIAIFIALAIAIGCANEVDAASASSGSSGVLMMRERRLSPERSFGAKQGNARDLEDDCNTGCQRTRVDKFQELKTQAAKAVAMAAHLQVQVDNARMPSERAAKLLAQNQAKRIHVFIPSFRNARWLVANLNALQLRAETGAVQYTVVSMEKTNAEHEHVRSLVQTTVKRVPVKVVHFTDYKGIGGGPLPYVFEWVSRHSNASITVLADTDAVVLANGWDERLISLYQQKPQLVLAGINPRGDRTDFAGQVEWNWMSYRTSFYRDRIRAAFPNNAPSLHDWGHWFTREAKRAGLEQYLWDETQGVFPGKSPTAVGLNGQLWVVHCFYLSRRSQEQVDDHAAWIITEEQEQAMLKWVQTTHPKLDDAVLERERCLAHRPPVKSAVSRDVAVAFGSIVAFVTCINVVRFLICARRCSKI